MWGILRPMENTPFERSTLSKRRAKRHRERVVQRLRYAKRLWKVPTLRLQMDGGNELLGGESGELATLLKREGIELIVSTPYTPEQNTN